MTDDLLYRRRAIAGDPVLTDAEIDHLRSQVPDDPIRLPPDSLACEMCGQAVATSVPVSSTSVMPNTASNSRMPTGTADFARCDGCTALHALADSYVLNHPDLGRRLGDRIARERIESVLIALEILDQEADPGTVLSRLHPATPGVRWKNPTSVTRGWCSPRPWAHVTTSQRQALRSAYAGVLRDRVALAEPPVEVRCPTGACLMCGVPSLLRPAIEVTRRGGPLATAQAIWRPVTTQPSSLGGRGPDLISGHACPPCAEAISDAGSVGQSSLAMALVTYVGSKSDRKGRHLRALLSDEDAPRLVGWGALPVPRVPNVRPFAHLRKIVDRL